jgi:hypothetical protein|tara:strand:- start:2840 stop:3052 length:213 start_codon:yes stop_codon:yes gene_type:complete
MLKSKQEINFLNEKTRRERKINPILDSERLERKLEYRQKLIDSGCNEDEATHSAIHMFDLSDGLQLQYPK